MYQSKEEIFIECMENSHHSETTSEAAIRAMQLYADQQVRLNSAWNRVEDGDIPKNTLLLLWNKSMISYVVGFYSNGRFIYSKLLYGTNKDYLQHKSDAQVIDVCPDKITHWKTVTPPQV